MRGHTPLDCGTRAGKVARRTGGWAALLLMACMAVPMSADPVSATEPAGAAEQTTEVRGAMREIADPLQVLLPLALSDARFSDPANREVIAEALARLAAGTAVLESHGTSREASFGFLSGWLARDAAEADRRFREGRPEESRYFLGELANDCIGCHSRLPSPGDSLLGASLFQSVPEGSLDPFETVRLQLMTRQFSQAMAGCEALLASPDWSPARLDTEGVLDDLLLLGVRLERDPARARRALEAFAARDDTPLHLRESVAAWSESLARLEADPGEGSLLDRARESAERAQARRRYPADRRGAVDDLQASSLIHRYLGRSGEPPPQDQRAEAHYLLGLTELRRTDAFWPSQADFHLEHAVRLAPGAAVARRAFAVLEQHTLVGYTGSGGLQLPPEVDAWLSELRALAEGV